MEGRCNNDDMSSILSSDDLNDFLSPGVACIKPVEVNKSEGYAEIEISIDGEPVEVDKKDASRKTLEAAQISLSDCLACTGCITSAEEILVAQHSHTQVLKALSDTSASGKVFIVSISHQVRASLATAFGINIQMIDAKLKDLFHNKLGFKYVVGMEVGRIIAIEAAVQEVLQSISRNEGNDSSGRGPILSSVCPGWTCYAEKSHPEIIQYLSRRKSPQQITASLVKKLISEEHGVGCSEIYHLSVMPCFDKKLEAARPDFTTDNAPDTDCVITAKEVVQLLLEKNIDIMQLGQTLLKDEELAPSKWPAKDQWQSNEGSSSGGYVFHVLRALKTKYDKSGIDTNVEVIPGKNNDTVEYHLVASDNTCEEKDKRVLAVLSQVYGFRNIQNMVRRLKKRTGRGQKPTNRRTAVLPSTLSIKTDLLNMIYVEVMACPGGCINGGGLVGRPENMTLKQWREQVEGTYNSIPERQVESQLAQKWISDLWNANENKTVDLVTVEYRAVEVKQELDNPALALGTHW